MKTTLSLAPWHTAAGLPGEQFPLGAGINTEETR